MKLSPRCGFLAENIAKSIIQRGLEEIMAVSRLNEVIISTAESSKAIKRMERSGDLRKLAPRIYTSNLEETAERILRRNWYHLLSELFPDALVSHRSALEFKPTASWGLYLTRSYRGKLELPGLTLHFNAGPPPLDDDLHLYGRLRVSGTARAYLENLEQTKDTGGERKTLTREQLEEKIESFLRTKGEAALNAVRDRSNAIAPQLDMKAEASILNQMINDLLGAGEVKNLVSPIAQARVLGEPIDPDRIALFEKLYQDLAGRDFPEYPEHNLTPNAYHNFAFFESYFSNYIEGTEFTIEEAKQIIATETPLPARDEDSHDVLGTYRITSSQKEMSLQPATPNHLLNLLRERHAVLLSARPGKHPGEFKDKNNRAGNTEFVDKQLVTGTLKRGFDWYQLLRHPFARAIYMMFLISEVHPFLDGNGRIARIMMNVELTAANLAKIIIPTVYREDYMGALKKLTRQRDPDPYIRMMLRAWEFSSTVYSENRDEMEQYLQSCNAFLEPKDGRLE